MWAQKHVKPFRWNVLYEIDDRLYHWIWFMINIFCFSRPNYRSNYQHRLQTPINSLPVFPSSPSASSGRSGGINSADARDDGNTFNNSDNDSTDNEYDSDANKELENMPFGVQNARSVLPARPTRNRPATAAPARVTFQSLCPSRRETVFLNLDKTDYEYRPNHYDEVYCVHPYTGHHTYIPQSNKVEEGVRTFASFFLLAFFRPIVDWEFLLYISHRNKHTHNTWQESSTTSTSTTNNTSFRWTK